MNYGMLLEDVQEVSKDKLKEVSFRVDEEFIQYVKELNIDDDIKKNLIKKSKDRAFFDMLLINCIKKVFPQLFGPTNNVNLLTQAFAYSIFAKLFIDRWSYRLYLTCVHRMLYDRQVLHQVICRRIHPALVQRSIHRRTHQRFR